MDQNDTEDLGEIPVMESQQFQIIHLTKNMRNGLRILEGSLNLQEGTIEKGTVVTKPAPKRVSKSKTAIKQIRLLCTQTKKLWRATTNTCTSYNEKINASKKVVSFNPNLDVTGDNTIDNDTKSDSDHKTITARIVSEGRAAVYNNPKPDIKGCPTIPGPGNIQGSSKGKKPLYS